MRRIRAAREVPWPATDGLGRALPLAPEADPPKREAGRVRHLLFRVALEGKESGSRRHEDARRRPGRRPLTDRCTHSISGASRYSATDRSDGTTR